MLWLCDITNVLVVTPDGDELVKPESAALLISVIGISNTAGRLIFGVVSDIINRNGSIAGFEITALTINNYCLFLCGLSVMAIPFSLTYNAVLFTSVLFGFFVCKSITALLTPLEGNRICLFHSRLYMSDFDHFGRLIRNR